MGGSAGGTDIFGGGDRSPGGISGTVFWVGGDCSIMSRTFEFDGKKYKKEKIKSNKLTYLSIFGLTLLLGLVKIYDTSLCFVLPMLVISFACGYPSIIAYMIAIALISYLTNDNYMLLIVSLTSVVLMQVMMYLKFIKSKYLALIIALVSLIFQNNIHLFQVLDLLQHHIP